MNTNQRIKELADMFQLEKQSDGTWGFRPSTHPR